MINIDLGVLEEQTILDYPSAHFLTAGYYTPLSTWVTRVNRVTQKNKFCAVCKNELESYVVWRPSYYRILDKMCPQGICSVACANVFIEQHKAEITVELAKEINNL
jgi:hypothetical protein